MRSIVPSQLDGIVTPVNPFGSEADRHMVAWAAAFQLMPSGRAATRLAATRPGALAAHCYPNAGHSDLCLIADWMTWLFLLDDLTDEGVYGRRPEDLEQMLSSVFFGSQARVRDAGNEFGSALADIVGRLGGRMLPAWRNRSRRGHRGALCGGNRDSAGDPGGRPQRGWQRHAGPRASGRSHRAESRRRRPGQWDPHNLFRYNKNIPPAS